MSFHEVPDSEFAKVDVYSAIKRARDGQGQLTLIQLAEAVSEALGDDTETFARAIYYPFLDKTRNPHT